MGYSPEAVQLALAYQAQTRGDEAQVGDQGGPGGEGEGEGVADRLPLACRARPGMCPPSPLRERAQPGTGSPAWRPVPWALQIVMHSPRTRPQVIDFCNNYTQLLGMGFSPSMAAGALVRSRNDATAAADLCLAASG